MILLSFIFFIQSFGSFYTLSKSPLEQSIILDLELLVRTEESTGWLLDETHLKQMKSRVMEITCQVPLHTLISLAHRFESKIQEVGSVRKRWMLLKEKQQKPKKSDFSSDLRFERMNKALGLGIRHRKKCPFWLDADSSFRGIHRDAHRIQLILESMGSGQLALQEKDWFLGGSGQGRLLFSYGFNLNTGLALGLEVGGASIFPKDANGQRTVKATWVAGLPLLFRGWWNNIRFDTELAGLTRLADESQAKPSYGFRVAQAVGVSPVRILGFLPHFMFWVGYELYGDFNQASPFADSNRLQVLRIGTRVGVNWDL